MAPRTLDAQAVMESLAAIRRELADIRQRLDDVVRLEVEHQNTKEALARAFGRIDIIDIRVSQLEQLSPMSEMIKKWVLNMVWVVVAAIATAGIALVVRVQSPNLPVIGGH